MAPIDRKKPGQGEPGPVTQTREPPELSSRGKVVVRSSSHPPGADSPITDPPPLDDAALGDALRTKKDTPAERPRKRRKVQAEQLAREHAAAEQAERNRRSDESARAAAATENARLRWLLAAIALALAAVYWLSR